MPGRSPTPASPTESPAESGSPSEPAASGTAVPVYFAGDGPGGRTVLFREFQRVEGDPLTEAARLVAGGGQPVDPDYRTLWPGVEITSVQATDGVLLVEIPSDGFTDRPDGMSRRDARLAVQQLVYTLQGVQQERVPVQVQREGGAPLFGLPTGTPFEARRGAAHPQPRQHHLARRGRHRQRRHPDRDRRGQLLRGQRAVPAPAGRQGDRARGLPVRGLDGQPAVPLRGGPAARRRHRRGRGPVRDRRPLAAAPRATARPIDTKTITVG